MHYKKSLKLPKGNQSRKSKDQKKRTKGQAMIYKTLHRN